jgi:hypothetical protein
MDNDSHPSWDAFWIMANELAGGTAATSEFELLLGQMAKDFWGISISKQIMADTYRAEGKGDLEKEFATRSHERMMAACEILQTLGDVKGIPRK